MWTVLLCPLALGLARDETPIVERTFDHGIRVVVAHAEDAPKQSTFGFLPVGLLHDDPHQAQFVHLVEHLLIRGTDPTGLEAEGMLINGETQASTMRLETLSDLEHWRESVARHRRWWTTRTVDANVLEVEKGRVAQEVAGTVPQGYTHKWADAAWAQIVRQGLDHAAVHGDVQGATVEQAEAAIAKHVDLRQLRFFTVGPTNPDDVFAAFEAEFAELELPRRDLPPKNTWRTDDEVRSYEGTWDLARHHLLLWTPVADDAASQLVARAAAMALASQLAVDPALSADGLTMAASDWTLPEGRFLKITASFSGEEALVAGKERIQELLRSALDQPQTVQMLQALLAQLTQPLDFGLIRQAQAKHLQGVARDYLEGQLLLSLADSDTVMGLSWDAKRETASGVDVDALPTMVAPLFDPAGYSSLILRPADS